jgi:hypothetical protein
MILLSMILVYYNSKTEKVKINWMEWCLFIAGSVILIVSWTWDYSAFIFEHYTFSKIWTVPAEELSQVISQYIPRKFYWGIYWIGEGVILAGILLLLKRLVGIVKREA